MICVAVFDTVQNERTEYTVATYESLKKRVNPEITRIFFIDNNSCKETKDFLKDAKVDDIFVLFIAGHGMYSQGDDATYYYLTHNADLSNLSSTAADFDLIEDLLQGIKPRKKLFLMDTCESGEIDEALDSLLTGFGIAKSISTEPLYLSQLTRGSLDYIALNCRGCGRDQKIYFE